MPSSNFTCSQNCIQSYVVHPQTPDVCEHFRPTQVTSEITLSCTTLAASHDSCGLLACISVVETWTFTHEKHRMPCNPALVNSVVGSFANQLCHSGWGHAFARALVAAACGDETRSIVD